jgi:hypothetical protein
VAGRASHLLGEDATRWARTVTANDAPLLLRADDVPLDVIDSLGRSVVEAVGEKRSTWRRWNLTAEAARQTMPYRFATTRIVKPSSEWSSTPPSAPPSG